MWNHEKNNNDKNKREMNLGHHHDIPAYKDSTLHKGQKNQTQIRVREQEREKRET